MARSRNIKPGFFENHLLWETTPYARLLFIGLWMLADKEGRLEYVPIKIKYKLFPTDDIDIEKCIEELESRNFVKSYEHSGNLFIQIVKFKKHQNPHKNEKDSEIPPPPKTTPPGGGNSLNNKDSSNFAKSTDKIDTNRADSLLLNPERGSLKEEGGNRDNVEPESAEDPPPPTKISDFQTFEWPNAWLRGWAEEYTPSLSWDDVVREVKVLFEKNETDGGGKINNRQVKSWLRMAEKYKTQKQGQHSPGATGKHGLPAGLSGGI